MRENSELSDVANLDLLLIYSSEKLLLLRAKGPCYSFSESFDVNDELLTL